MMRSSITIQKTFRVFHTLTKIAMILSFICAGLAHLGTLCGIVWYHGGTVIGADREMLLTLTGTDGLREMIAVLWVYTIVALTDGILLVHALGYLKMELADGTPFTHRGADRIRGLGIRTIVLPLVAAILIAVVYAVFDLPGNAVNHWDNAYSVTMGIVLILASLIFRYGAELGEDSDKK